MPSLIAEPFFQNLLVLHLFRQKNRCGYIRCSAVKLFDKIRDDLTGSLRLPDLEIIVIPSYQSAAADKKDLHNGILLIFRKRQNIPILVSPADHTLCLRDRLDMIKDLFVSGCLLVL